MQTRTRRWRRNRRDMWAVLKWVGFVVFCVVVIVLWAAVTGPT